MNTQYRYCQNHPRGNWRAGEYQCSEGRSKREFCKEGRDESQSTSSAMAIQKRLRAQHYGMTADEQERERNLIDLHKCEARGGGR